MKNRILDNFGMKILSVIIAIIIWIIVANVDDYKTTKQITGIPIEFINGEAITEKNKVYEVPEGTTIDIIVKGRRKLVEHLDSDDFKAVADLSKMSLTNAVRVDVSAVRSVVAKETSISSHNDSVVVVVEDKVEKQLPITVRSFSLVADGFAIRNKTVTPNLITVTGAGSVVNDVESVVVDVDVKGANHALTFFEAPVFLNKNGEKLDASKFEYDVDNVETYIEILPTKELSVKLKTTGEPEEGYAIASLDYQPTTIHVVGDAKDLARVEEIVIDDIDVTDCKVDMETSIDITDYLPDGITLADENPEIMVKIKIEEIKEKVLFLENDDINIIGKKSDYTYSFTANNSNALKLNGLQSDIENVKINNFIPRIDVTGYGPGTYSFVVDMRDVDGIKVLNTIKIQLEIRQKE